MKQHNPKAIADKYYGDIFSRKLREGGRCCQFGPSIFKAGIGGSNLLIDKETLAVFQLGSYFGRYGDLPFQDYENKLGLFNWPVQGGSPTPNDDKILLYQAAALKQQEATANEGVGEVQVSDGAQVSDEAELSNKADAEQLIDAANVEAEQMLFEAADAEDANNLKLAEDLYRKAIALLIKDSPNVTRDNFLMLAYSAFGRLLVSQEQFLAATEPLSESVVLYQSSEHKEDLYFAAMICVQLLGECLTALGRADELEALSQALER